ncbi:methyl-CpG-binding domain protein 4-like [Cylas formicarius]|uniref:methyl-CpG-binding domain protein 4-like n=1 Tax=Cylas formicarius TaxID=197179 RepID=UPI00295868EA|nr:methyl-CpG-binding domain protein 4-like [Cylas formicarius]
MKSMLTVSRYFLKADSDSDSGECPSKKEEKPIAQCEKQLKKRRKRKKKIIADLDVEETERKPAKSDKNESEEDKGGNETEEEEKKIKIEQLDDRRTRIEKPMDFGSPTDRFWAVKKEFLVPIWVPPKSPHNLLEEDLYYDPWALLVATIFLNKTSCKSARPYVFWFLEENQDALAVLEKKPGDLEKYFAKLGLQKTRSVQVWRMSYDFVYKQWRRVKDLYGVGRYGEDAFRMFCLGDFSVEPKDRFLKIYKAWYELKEREDVAKEMAGR